MRFFVAILLVIFCVEMMQAQPIKDQKKIEGLSSFYQEGMVLWRGFSHQWTYNHRLNRLGSYVVNPSKKTRPHKASLHHASATGIGADVGKYDGHYTFVAANGVRMFSDMKEIDFSGKEGALHSKKVEVEMSLPSDVFTAGNFEVVLNGFDVISTQKADKLHLFHLSVEDVEYVPNWNKVRFTINVGMVVRCQSLECNRFNNKFDYKVQVYYVILNGEEQSFASTENSFHELYTWDKDKEIVMRPIQKKIEGVGKSQYLDAAVAFKSLTITLDQPHWFLEWRSVVHPQNALNPSLAYDPQKGSMQYEVDVLFKQWRSDMKKESASPRHSRYSSKKPGWAAFSGSVVLLQFADAYVMNGREMGVIKWEGSNNLADDTALFQHELVFDDQVLSMKESDWKKLEAAKSKRVDEQYAIFVGDLDRIKEQRKVDKKEERDKRKWNRQFDRIEK